MEQGSEDGKILGQYRLMEKLGEGAAGAVYRAEHDILEREYAVKIVHRRLAQNEQFRQRFFREARLAAKLIHPNIVRVITADVHDEFYYLVMEYIEGESLEAKVQRGALDVRQAVRYVEQVLKGLAYAHEEGLLHRDVKAENVLIDTDDIPRLADFGLVIDVNKGSDLTAQDAIVGTPYYMPPEQWKSDEGLDGPVDVFSVGVLLYYLLTKRFPFPGNSPLEVMYRVTNQEAEPLEIPPIEGVDPTTNAELCASLVSIVEQAIARSRDDRFDSADDFRRALSRWLKRADSNPDTSLDEQTRPAESADEDGPAGRRRRETPTEPLSSPSTPRKPGMTTNNAPAIDLTTEYVEIADGTYWVGKRPNDEIFYANPYLRRFTGNGDEAEAFNLLIDPGSSKDFSVVQSKVSQVVGSVNNVSSVFINHQDPDVGSSVGLMLGRYTPDAHVLCTEDTWRLVHYYNIPRERFVPLEKYPRGIKLPTDDVVIPVPSPFCHFVGAMMLYDPETRVLFSGDLFGGLTDRDADGLYADDSDWTGMRAFHQIYMPTRTALQNAIDNIRALDPPVEIIAPQHGRVIRGSYVEKYMARLYDLPVGLDILDDRQASDEELQAWTTVMGRILDVVRDTDVDAAELLSGDPNLSGRITFDGGELRIENLGKTSVERAVRILCDEVPHTTANSIKYEAVFASEELGLPTPQVELDEDGDGGSKDDGAKMDAASQFDVA